MSIRPILQIYLQRISVLEERVPEKFFFSNLE